MSSDSKIPTGKWLVLYNPQSGKKQKGKEHLQYLASFFATKLQEPYYFHPLKNPEKDKKEILELLETQNIKNILVVGGDGTLRQVAQWLYQTPYQSIPLSFFPSGSANIFAKMLGIPEESLHYLKNPTHLPLYPGVLNGKDIFFIAACFGYMAAITTETPRKHKKRFGPWAYLLSGIKQSFLPSQRQKLTEVTFLTPFQKKTSLNSLLLLTPPFTRKYLFTEIPPQSLLQMSIKSPSFLAFTEVLYQLIASTLPRGKKKEESLSFHTNNKFSFQGDFSHFHLDGDILPPPKEVQICASSTPFYVLVPKADEKNTSKL